MSESECPVTVIVAGCAECHACEPEPLIESCAFPTVEAAKVWGVERTGRSWMAHPQGGEHIVTGQGSIWLLPTADERDDHDMPAWAHKAAMGEGQ